jgi:hypothetical protein
VTFDVRPFMIEFAQGKVPKENLARFAASYCYQVDNFKRFVAQVYANAEPRDVGVRARPREGPGRRARRVRVARGGRT